MTGLRGASQGRMTPEIAYQRRESAQTAPHIAGCVICSFSPTGPLRAAAHQLLQPPPARGHGHPGGPQGPQRDAGPRAHFGAPRSRVGCALSSKREPRACCGPVMPSALESDAPMTSPTARRIRFDVCRGRIHRELGRLVLSFVGGTRCRHHLAAMGFADDAPCARALPLRVVFGEVFGEVFGALFRGPISHRPHPSCSAAPGSRQPTSPGLALSPSLLTFPVPSPRLFRRRSLLRTSTTTSRW